MIRKEISSSVVFLEQVEDEKIKREKNSNDSNGFPNKRSQIKLEL